MSKLLQVSQLSVTFGSKQVLQQVDFSLEEGQIGCLLGPSGCGKTTLLRAIAGFEQPTEGSIEMLGRIISDRSSVLVPEKRNIGMVFQDFALFPNMTIAQNIGFGLRKATDKQRRERVTELLSMIGLPTIGARYPHQISGGQQQRVALARAMAPKPAILLMDEPFSSLDVALRESLAKEVREILKQEQMTAVLVTHDQHEAFAMADQISVMNEGLIEQTDSAYQLYHQPLNRFVAEFVGEGVIIPGMVVGKRTVNTELGNIHGHVPSGCLPGCRVEMLVRPDDIVHDENATESAVVVERSFRGSNFLYTLRMPSGVEVLALVPSHHDYAIHQKLGIRLDVDHLVIFKGRDVDK